MDVRGEQRDNRGGVLLTNAPLFITAAHELKSPLALLRQLALTLEEGTLTEQEILDLGTRMRLTSERALRLTTDLTKTARLEDGLFALEPINPVSLCEEVANELQPLYVAKGKKLELSGRRKPLLGLANRDLLRRILLNFIDNALYYSDQESPVKITASTREKGQQIRLGVRDYGPMIPAKVWSTLGRGMGSDMQIMHNRPESSGLGIFITQQFANAMQAEVGVQRHRDGVTFYVDIAASTQLRLL